MDELNNILFDACRHGKVEVIKFVVKNNPNLTTKKDAQNNTALHLACESGLLLDGIECLCSAYPDALTMFNDEGASPFHMICFHGKSLENLKFLHNKLAIGLATTNENGDLPLHWISDTASEELVEYLIEQFPKSAEVKNKEEALPIHIACNKGLSLNVIRLLHEAYPDGILQPDKDGILPIHDACEGVPNLELVKFFHDVSPKLFQMADKNGNLALHYAMCSSPEVVQFVMGADKVALQTPNSSGYLPIHKACSLAVEVSIIKILNEHYPEGIKVKTTKGHLPFHLATTSLHILTFLHGLFGDAVKTPDKIGRYPIHIACEQGAPLNVITFLSEKYPKAARKSDHSKKLPLHHAIVNKLPFLTIKYLIELYPDALRHSDANNHLPFHLLFYHSNNIEIFQFLRTNYCQEFEELTVNPTKVKPYGAPLSSQKKQQKPLPSLQNHASIEQHILTKHPDLENHQHVKVEESLRDDQQNSLVTVQSQSTTKQEDATLNPDLENHKPHDNARRSIKAEDSVIDEKQDVSFPIIAPLRAGRRNFQNSDESDSCGDDDSCSSNDSVDQGQPMETEIIENNRQPKQNEVETEEKIEVFRKKIALSKETEEELNHHNYIDSVHKRPRIESKRPEDTSEKSTRNNTKNGVFSASSSKVQFRWSQDEIKAVLSGLRNFLENKISIERIYICISQKVKTRNPRQCFDFIRRTKTKVENNKKHTSEEYTIYKLLKSYNNYDLPSHGIGKSSRNHSTNSFTKTTELSQTQYSPPTSSLLLTSQELNHDNYIDSVQKRKRIGSLRASTIASAFAASENTSDDKPNEDKSIQKLNAEVSEEKNKKPTIKLALNSEVSEEQNKNPIIKIAKNNLINASASKNDQFRWTQVEKEVFISSLRAFGETNQNGCVFSYVSHQLKTRNYKQCYDLAHRIKMKVLKNKKCKSDDMIIYNLLKTYNDNYLISNKNDESQPRNDRANATSNNTTASPQSKHSPLSSLTLGKQRDKQKGPWSQNEIEIFLSALRSFSFNGFMEKKNLFEHISNELKTRNYKQCYDFPRNIKRRFEASQSVTPEEYVIYAIFKKYEKDQVFQNSTKNSNDNDRSNKSSSSFKDATTNNTSHAVLLQHSPSPLSELKTNKEHKSNSISTINLDCDAYNSDENEEHCLV